MAPVHRTQHQEDGGSDDARVQHVRDAAGGVNNGRRTGQPRPFKRALVWRVSTDPDNYLASSSGCAAFWSAFCTFNLAVMGSSVLPMPYAISRVGVLTGLLTMLLVALCNDYTTCLMISAAYATGLDSFEALALWAGGPRWKVFTQAVLIALLWAPNSGGISLMGDVAQVMVGQVQDIYYSSTAAGAAAAAAGLGAISSNSSSIVTSSVVSSDATSGSSWLSAGGDWLWLRAGDGQSWMVAMTVLAVLPLSCQKHMRNLESAAAAGLVVVLGLLGALAYRAISAGMPALADGQVPLWSLQLSDRLPEAFSLLGYAFYLQPLIMPIIREMPEGATGRSALIAAVHSALLGSSLFLYAGVGVFGAALFGADTQTNVMLNGLTGSPWFGLALNGMMLFYLAAGAAACQFPLRTAIDAIVVGEHVPMTLPRAVLINAVTLGVSLCVALVTPGGAEKVYAVVGASGVCVMCYVLPVVIHLKLLHSRHLTARGHAAAKETALAAAAAGSPGGALVGAGAPADSVRAPPVLGILLPGDTGGSSDGAAALSVPLLAPSSPHSSVSSLTGLNGLPLATAGALLPVRLAPRLLRPLVAVPGRPVWLEVLVRVLLPLLVMCLGIGFSLAALSVALGDIFGAS